MIGVVIVSHSRKLAEGVCELAEQMARGQVAIAAAGGIDDDAAPIGTDALKVQQAIESVYSDDGVIVLMDLGSALLSADTALELLPKGQRGCVHLCSAPLVEGAVSAVIAAASGRSIEQVIAEADGSLMAKADQLTTPPLAPGPGARLTASGDVADEVALTLVNPLGIHARPAAQIVRTAAGYDARVSLRNASTSGPIADAASINAIMMLGARQGHRLALSATGPEVLEALGALTDLIESGFGEQEAILRPMPDQPERSPHIEPDGELVGIGATDGIAIGPTAVYSAPRVRTPIEAAKDPEEEWQCLQEALVAADKELAASLSSSPVGSGAECDAILGVQQLFLQDPALLDAAHRRILEVKLSAASAWADTIDEVAGRYAEHEIGRVRSRAPDLDDVGQRVLRHLVDSPSTPLDLPDTVGILVADDLLPSECATLDAKKVEGICLASGSANSHSAILVRALGIPMVVDLGQDILRLADGTPLAMDGQSGHVWVCPGVSVRRALEARRADTRARQRAALATSSRPGRTRDGERVHVLANIGSVPEARRAHGLGAEGVGLLRTEFLFQSHLEAPAEDEHVSAYVAVGEASGSGKLVIRTFDIGGDKPAWGLEAAKEANPCLGLRGIRLALQEPYVLQTQMRAILRVASRSSPRRQVALLLPMVSTLGEIRAAKEMLATTEDELAKGGIAYGRALLGIMVEVPSAVTMLDLLAPEVDYVSIGSNDLSQYVMAVDRTNPSVASIADPFDPALLRMIHQAIVACEGSGTPVGLCGELAAEPLALPLLLGMGLRELSMTPVVIPSAKEAIAQIDVTEAAKIVPKALNAESPRAVRLLVAEGFPHLGHGGRQARP